MSSFVHDPGKWSQGLEELANLHAQIQSDLSRCRCPRCDRFGIVSGADDYGTGYHCAWIHIFWVINSATAKTLEGA